MRELFTAADLARIKKNAALIIFVVVFAIGAMLIMVSVTASDDEPKSDEKTNTEEIIEILEDGN